MKIVIAGASGFLGTALRSHLKDAGHELTQLVRREPTAEGQVRWDPHAGSVDGHLIASADVVVNVAGAPIAHWPLTASYRETLLQSRVAPTSTLAEAIAGADTKPALVNTSAIGYYGDRGDELLDEDAAPGHGFLADLVRQWEAAVGPAVDAGARVAVFRPGIVLDRTGGVLKLMRLPFLLGVGGRIGNGRQYFPTVSLHDYLSVVGRLVSDDAMRGTFNVVAPHPATNQEFTKELGRRLHRPTVVVVPSFALKPLGAELSKEVIGSIRATPRRLLDAGFEFAHPTVREQLEAAFGSSSRD